MLTAPELVKLIKAHNILSKITIPKKAINNVNDLIKLIESKNYSVDHNKKSIKPKVQRGKQITLKQAEEITKPKVDPVVAKQKRETKKKEKEEEKKKDRIEVPGCSEVVKNQILDFIYNKEITNQEVYFPSIRKFWIRFIFMIVLPLIIIFYVNAFAHFLLLNKLYLLACLYFVIGTLSCWRLYKNYKLMVTPEFIMVQSGFWDIDTKIIEPYKIQAIITNQLFWQKRLNIGSVYLYTAGGTISFTTGFYNQITELSNTWLYQVETSTKKWM